MLVCENYHGAVEDKHIINAAFFGALAFVVDNPSVREIIVLITCLHNSIGQIDVFTVHKECFIEQSNFIQNTFTHHHESTTQDFNLVGFKFAEIAQVVFAKGARFWKQ